jgi:hypothetical protein
MGCLLPEKKKKTSFLPCSRPTNLAPYSTPLKILKFTREEMVECQLKGLFYNCDDNFFPGNKCKELKLLMTNFKDVANEEVEASSMEDLPHIDDTTSLDDSPEVEPLISLHTLTGSFPPQTLKLIGYIKYRKFIIFINS